MLKHESMNYMRILAVVFAVLLAASVAAQADSSWGSGAAAQNLQEVTDEGDTTTNDITTGGLTVGTGDKITLNATGTVWMEAPTDAGSADKLAFRSPVIFSPSGGVTASSMGLELVTTSSTHAGSFINNGAGNALNVGNYGSGRGAVIVKEHAGNTEALQVGVNSGDGAAIKAASNATNATSHLLWLQAQSGGFTAPVIQSEITSATSTSAIHALLRSNIYGTNRDVVRINRSGSLAIGPQVLSTDIGDPLSGLDEIVLFASGSIKTRGNIHATDSLYVSNRIVSEDDMIIGSDVGGTLSASWFDDPYNVHFVNNQNTGRGVKVINIYDGAAAPATIRFDKIRNNGGAVRAGAAEDQILSISSTTADSGSNIVGYTNLKTYVDSPTAGDHSGRYEFQVSESGAANVNFLTISGGDSAITAERLVYATQGVNFGASGGDTTLDHYATGTWTPQYYGATIEGDCATGTTATGNYTRVGRIVFFDLTMNTTACAISPTGAARIKLPSGVTGSNGSVTINAISNYSMTDGFIPMGYIGGDYINLYESPIGVGGAGNALAVDDNNVFLLYLSGFVQM